MPKAKRFRSPSNIQAFCSLAYGRRCHYATDVSQEILAKGMKKFKLRVPRSEIRKECQPNLNSISLSWKKHWVLCSPGCIEIFNKPILPHIHIRWYGPIMYMSMFRFLKWESSAVKLSPYHWFQTQYGARRLHLFIPYHAMSANPRRENWFHISPYAWN